MRRLSPIKNICLIIVINSRRYIPPSSRVRDNPIFSAAQIRRNEIMVLHLYQLEKLAGLDHSTFSANYNETLQKLREQYDLEGTFDHFLLGMEKSTEALNQSMLLQSDLKMILSVGADLLDFTKQ